MRHVAIALLLAGCISERSEPCQDPADGRPDSIPASADATLELHRPTPNFSIQLDLLEGRDVEMAVVLEQNSDFYAETSDGADGCPGDTIMKLFKGSQLVGKDDDGGVRRCSLLDLRGLQGGAYTLVVSGFRGSSFDGLALDVRF